MTAILGLNAFHADAAASLVVDGTVVAAVAEERLGRRVKHYAGFPAEAVRAVLDIGNLGLDDVDWVAVGHRPTANLWHKATYTARRPLAALGSVRTFLRREHRLSGLTEVLASTCGIPLSACQFQLRHVEHHLAHVASSFYCSGFEDAAALSYDASGDFVSTMFARCSADEGIEVLRRIHLPNSLGYFYTSICQFIGFDRYGEEYKVMGLAAYGDPDPYRSLMEKIAEVRDNGAFYLDPTYFSGLLQQSHERLVSDDGVLRVPPLYSNLLVEELGEPRSRDQPMSDRDKNLAAACQTRFEELVLNCLWWLHDEVDSPNLVTAGGAALNGVCNGRILRDTSFKQSYIHCAAGDDGTAVGAALYIWNEVLRGERSPEVYDVYLGPCYSEEDIHEAMAHCGLRGERLERSELLNRTADILAAGRLVGWYQGRSEWGPRALGNRSILAHPGIADMKEIINRRVKRREQFRPFAPTILDERVEDYFVENIRSPFMMHVVEIQEERRNEILAVNHVDGTGRLHSVTREQNPLYYDLISRFEDRTGLPILLNTSFNENEPIVDTPEQAIECFLRNDLDALVLGRYLLQKEQINHT